MAPGRLHADHRILQRIAVKVNFREHPPAHCHVFYAGHKAVLELQSLRITPGSLPSARQADLLRWAARHRAELLQAWKDCHDRRLPATIPYP